MGYGTFNATTYASTASTMRGKTTDEIYTSRSIDDYLNPKGVKIRESRDSIDSPAATPIIVGLDVTGSMGMLADTIARQGLGTLFTGILDRKPVTDAGELPREDERMRYDDNTNNENTWQGALRFAPLDATEMAHRCYDDFGGVALKIVLTHCDQKEPPFNLRADLYASGPTRETITVSAP